MKVTRTKRLGYALVLGSWLLTPGVLVGQMHDEGAAVAQLLQYDPSRQILLTVIDAGNGPTSYVVATAAVRATPRWDGKGAPPLSVERAVSLAWQALRKRKRKTGQLVLQSIALSRITSGLVPDRWYYVASFQQDLMALQDQDEWPRMELVYLLMDGSTVEPKK
ncbi:MAG: hypothetical protein HN742_18305 [Lentisphaerae bacterium]|jgi:hypothetical protein|nr:hypothetical protein [Lentisphaerota bacterium]MBT4819936.1 hypothetical protein [Lentisphaerota bacterium]MBT5611858.1 hypothetical protein [Lentisphaerota bacterium]MBT7059315.1 hypothetical protein [Lentisphaerota bacterium]MBT7843838.1 hypothetical protein [Lentisphaerota bacterium]